MIIVFQVLLVLSTIAFVTTPFYWVGGRPQRSKQITAELKRVLDKKQHLLLNLKDLDFEFQMGKIAEDDHERLSRHYRAQVVNVMKKIDRLGEITKQSG